MRRPARLATRTTRFGAALALALLVSVRVAGAVPAVFQGDPTDAGGQPLIVLPGVPYVDWGPDREWQTNDDVIAPGIVGDVDLVVRAGDAYVPGSNAIPAPASDLESAVAVSAGGLQFPLAGTELPFQVIVSDGAASPAAGHPLTASDLDGRSALVLAYADLDGDGVLGRTSADTAGSSDNALERQEALFLVGRRYAVVQSGLASGGLGVTLGLPASAGGLGIVLAAGAITGATPPLYTDGPWIATLLPCMWPNDLAELTGNQVRPPDPNGLFDLEIEAEQLFCPAPGHAVLGTPYAIPLDGSSVTNDIARALSGAATAVTFARPLQSAGFAADPARRVLPAIGPGGVRRVVEPIVSAAIADDGPGNPLTVAVFPADSLGNQADPPSPGTSRIALEASANLRIVSPDVDGDPRRETLPLDAAELSSVVIDDAGGAGDGGGGGQLVASLDGEIAGVLRVTFGTGGTPAGLVSARAVLRFNDDDFLKERVTARFEVHGDATAMNPSTHDLTVTVRNRKGETIYARTFPAGLLTPGAAGRAFRYKDPSGVSIGRVLHLNVRRGAVNPLKHNVRLSVKGVDLKRVDPDDRTLEISATFGATSFDDELDCATAGATTSVCVR